MRFDKLDGFGAVQSISPIAGHADRSIIGDGDGTYFVSPASSAAQSPAQFSSVGSALAEVSQGTDSFHSTTGGGDGQHSVNGTCVGAAIDPCQLDFEADAGEKESAEHEALGYFQQVGLAVSQLARFDHTCVDAVSNHLGSSCHDPAAWGLPGTVALANACGVADPSSLLEPCFLQALQLEKQDIWKYAVHLSKSSRRERSLDDASQAFAILQVRSLPPVHLTARPALPYLITPHLTCLRSTDSLTTSSDRLKRLRRRLGHPRTSYADHCSST